MADQHAAEQPLKRVQRGTGHKPASWPEGTKSVKHLLGARAGLPSSAMELRAFIDWIRDQGATESCVGQAGARAAHLRACKQLQDHQALPSNELPAFPSALAFYQLAVQAEGSEKFGDFGADPAKLMQALATKGIARESAYPFPTLDEFGNPKDKEAVTRNVPLDVLEQACDYKLADEKAYYLIDSDPEHSPDDVRQALAQGFPVTIAVQVDKAFNDYDGKSVLGPPQGDTRGGHDVVLIGYEGDWFWGVNSWGSGWGDGGLFRISAAAVAAATDKFVFEVVPIWPEAERIVKNTQEVQVS